MKAKKILDLFPPPDFLNFPYAGIHISENSVRCIKFAETNGKLQIEKYAEKSLPSVTIDFGRINDNKEIIKALGDLKKELNLNYVKVSLPEEKVYLFRTEIPRVGRNEIRSAIEFKIEENVPLPAGEVVFDYILVNPNSKEKKENLEIIVSALPINIVDAYVAMLENAGLVPLSLGIASQSIARAIMPSFDNRAFLIVHFGFEKAGLYIVADNVVHFTSTISTKGESFDNPVFLSSEIRKIQAYWNSMKENYGKKEKHISGIMVCGEGIGENIIPYLSANNKISATLANVWTNVFDLDEFVPSMPFVDSLKFAPAVGLALPSDILI